MSTETAIPLWVNRRIPVIGVTGEIESGKTLFCLSIDPNCFGRDRSQPATTRHWDSEGSATTYADGLHFEHRNLAEIMLQEHPDGHKPIDLFLHWVADMRAIEPGRYRVLALDTVTEIEDGLVDWVRTHPEAFGHTRGQYQNMQGLMWGDVKAYWKRLLSETMARCETFVFASHMKAVWRGSSTVPGQRQAKGKETLMELASLYMRLERSPEPNKAKAPRKPIGIVLKSRLANFDPGSGETFPILPPRLPEATPDAIREYIKTPPDYTKLKKGEQAVAETMSDDERLAVEASIASDRAQAATAELSKTELIRQAAAAQAKMMEQQGAAQGPATAVQLEPPHDPPEYSQAANGPCMEDQRHKIIGLFEALGMDPENARQVLANREAAKLADLNVKQADELIAKLSERATTEGVDIPF